MSINDEIKYLDELNNLLKHIEKPLNIYQIKKKFSLTLHDSKVLLIDYILNNNDLIIFFCVTYKTLNGINKSIIPSYSKKFEDVFKYDILDLYAYAIFLKSRYEGINDFSVLCHENDIISNIIVNKTDIVKAMNNVVINTKPKIDIKLSKAVIQEENEEFFYDIGNEIIPSRIEVIEKPYFDILKNVEYSSSNFNQSNNNISNNIEIDKPIKRKASDSTESLNIKKKRDISEKDIDMNETKKIKKIKKIKKSNTYVDEKGYLVTRDEWEDEEYWSDDKSLKPVIQPKIIDNKAKKPTVKKVSGNQSSLSNFFSKK